MGDIETTGSQQAGAIILWRCYSCKVGKPAEAFCKASNSTRVPKGRPVSGECRECRKIAWQKWYSRNKQRVKDNKAEWCKNHPERHRVLQLRRYNKKRAKEYGVGYDDSVDVFELYEKNNGICQICMEACSQEDMTVDHKIPMSKGGPHTWDNVQIAHRVCNSQKYNKKVT